MYVIKEDFMRVPLKIFSEPGFIGDEAIQQMKNISSMSSVFHHTAIMPDGHLGYGAAIGAVAAFTDIVCPSIVGVDIGCGMCAVKTNLTSIEPDALKEIMGKIRERIPLGFNRHREKQEWSGFNKAPDVPIVQQQLNAAKYQLGTLGGGNHFIEIQKGSDGFIWIMLHSGSRNFGLKVAQEYYQKALALCKQRHWDLPDKELAFLPIESPEAKEYMAAMNFALGFAKANRFAMLLKIKKSVVEVIPEVTFNKAINIHHNYAIREHHFGSEVIVHRKGATSAKKGQLGIIPGSQGTKSYIVRGKGNPESFMSCSHGAGRKMGRRQAQRELDLKAEKKRLDDQGIIHAIRHVSDLDEAAGAYKDISKVMENQKDLVDIVVELSPLAVIKA